MLILSKIFPTFSVLVKGTSAVVSYAEFWSGLQKISGPSKEAADPTSHMNHVALYY